MSSLIPEWVIQLTWFAAALGATGAFWYFLGKRRYRVALGSAIATVVFVIVAIAFHRHNDRVGRRPAESLQATVTPERVSAAGVGVPTVVAKSAPPVATGAANEGSEEVTIARDPSYSSITMDEYFDQWYHKANTSLQRDALEEQLLNRRVVWQGVVKEVERKSDGTLRVIVDAEHTYGTAFLDFDNTQRSELLRLNPKQVIRFTGVVRTIISSTFLKDCKLLRVVR